MKRKTPYTHSLRDPITTHSRKEKMTDDLQQKIEYATALMRESKYTTILSGAGISTHSGIPDFRSNQSGLWRKFDPFEVASLTAFRHNPERFFEWMRPFAKVMLKAKPNEAHLGIAHLEEKGIVQAIITQNIDALHQRAGSHNVIEVHGSMQKMTCMRCYHHFDAQDYIIPYIENGTVPRCPRCNGILKPDIILMEEQLPVEVWQRAVEATQNCDLMIIIGSSLEVSPVSYLPYQALEHGAKLIMINKTPTYIDDRAEILFHYDLIDIVPALERQLLGW